MTETDIRRALMQFVEQRDALVAQRDELNVKIINTEQNIRNLQSALTETLFAAEHELEYGTIGLTEAVRTIFRRAGKPLAAAEVKTSLKIIGFDLDRFANPTGAVVNTLQRMAKGGELVFNAATDTYRLKDAFEAFKIAHDAKMARDKRNPRPQGRFSLDQTRPARKEK
jgi:hypothetical protein